MQLSSNKIDIFSSSTVIRITEIIVKKFISNKTFQYDEFDDIKQTIIEKFWLKKERIANSFSNKAKPETYISAVIYKMTLEIIRERQNRLKKENEYTDNIKNYGSQKTINPEERLIINNEKEYLKRVFVTLGNERTKTLLFLKAFFRMEIYENDILNYYPKANCPKIMQQLSDSGNMKDKEIYQILSEILSETEEKEVKSDAVRMFVGKQVNKIINRLNNRKEQTYYNKESLEVLMEQTFL